MKVFEELQAPVMQNKHGENVISADFGKEAFARLEIELDAYNNAGQLTLAIGEVQTPDGRVEPKPGAWLIYREMKFTPRPGKNRFFMDLPQHVSPYQKTYQRSKVIAPEIGFGGEIAPFRYAEIAGTGMKSVKFIRHAMFGPFDDNAADFTCSDEGLNKVWDFCKYSIKATSPFGVYIDGDRERQAFEGDAYINALGAYCTGGGYELARRTITFLLDYYPQCCAEYRFFGPVLVRDYLLYSGDDIMYRRYWREDLPDRLLNIYLQSDGLIHNCYGDMLSGYHHEHQFEYLPLWPLQMQELVDWPFEERGGYEYGELNFSVNAFRYWALCMMAELEPQNFAYASEAATLRQKIHTTFRKHPGFFADNAKSSHMAFHPAMIALNFGIAEPEDVSGLFATLKPQGMACSVYGAQYFLDACFQHGETQHAINLMRADGDRSWLNMMKQGATVTMEAWSNAVKPNQDWNHAWGTAPANVIPRRLCGIRPLASGFSKFVIDPQPGDIKEFSLKHPTPHGAIFLHYDMGHLEVTVPEGTMGVCRGPLYPVGKHTIKL